MSTFTVGVVTSHSTSYLLKVEDENTFTTFLGANFNTEANFQSMEGAYSVAYDFFKIIMGYSEINAREAALLQVLQGAGVKCLKEILHLPIGKAENLTPGAVMLWTRAVINKIGIMKIIKK